MADHRPRVLVVTPDFPPASGGIQLLIHRVVDNLKQMDRSVVTLSQHGDLAFDRGQPYDVVRARRGGSHRWSIGRLCAATVREGLARRPDVVLSGHLATAPATALIRKALRVPVIQYLHGVELEDRPALTRFALAHADRAIAVSRHTMARAIAHGANESILVRISPGVDSAPGHHNARDTTPTLVTVASLDYRYKGHDVLAKALPLVLTRVPDARWVIVGDGPLRPVLERLVESNAVAHRVTFLGRVSDEERNSWLERGHVFAMPSRVDANGGGGEGFGIAYLEASSHGLPVVAGRAGGATDAIDDHRTGFLVDPTDHVEVAEAVTSLFTDATRASRMGIVGVAKARARSWAVVAQEVERELSRVARGRDFLDENAQI